MKIAKVLGWKRKRVRLLWMGKKQPTRREMSVINAAAKLVELRSARRRSGPVRASRRKRSRRSRECKPLSLYGREAEKPQP